MNMRSAKPLNRLNKFSATIFYPDENNRGSVWELLWLAILFLIGFVLWGKFLSWNSLSLDFHDWAHINIPRLRFLQNSINSGVLPLHMAGKESLHGITDRFFALPDVITTPQTLLLSLFNIPTFILIDVLLHFFIGFCGLLWFRKRYQLSAFSFSILFFLFNFNGFILSHYSVGHFTWGAYFLYPLVFTFIFRFLDGEQGWRWLTGFSFVLFYMILAGGQHFFTWVLIFLGLLCIFCWKRSLWLVGTGCFSGILSAVRLLPPALELKNFNELKDLIFVGGYPSLKDVLDSMLMMGRDLPIKQAYVQYNIWFYSKYTWEFNFYLGIIGVIFLIIFGLYFWLRKPEPIYKELIVPFLIMVALSIGTNFLPIKYSGIPLFGSERVLSRIISLPVVLLMLLAVQNFQIWLNQHRPGAWQQFALMGGLGLFVSDLYNNLRIWRLSESAIIFKPTPLDPTESLVANHTDPQYLLILTIGLVLTLATAIFLFIMSIREKRLKNIQ